MESEKKQNRYKNINITIIYFLALGFKILWLEYNYCCTIGGILNPLTSKQTLWENNLIYNSFGEDLQNIKIWKCTENVEWVIRSHLSKNRQCNDKIKWQRSTKHYTDN